MTERLILYVTAPDAQTAEKIADALVVERLAACVNIHGKMQSIFVWEGAKEKSDEWALFVKTTRAAAADAREKIAAIHPYDTPCIIALPIAEEHSAPEFLAWISETARAAKTKS